MILQQQEFEKLCEDKGPLLRDYYLQRNLEPLKSHGNLQYYYKSEGKGRKKEACVIILVHSEEWPYRNLKPLGIQKLSPFIGRLMDKDELIDQHFALRMTSLVYDNWESLIEDERKIAGDEFADKLLKFKDQWPLSGKAAPLRPGIQSSLNFSGEKTMKEIMED